MDHHQYLRLNPQQIAAFQLLSLSLLSLPATKSRFACSGSFHTGTVPRSFLHTYEAGLSPSSYMCTAHSSAKQSHTWSPISSTVSLYCHSLKLTDISTETPCNLIISPRENRSASRVTTLSISGFDYKSSLIRSRTVVIIFRPRPWMFSHFRSTLCDALSQGFLRHLYEGSPTLCRCFASFAKVCH